MEAVSIGRIVHFILANGEHRPGIIVRVWPGEYGNEKVKDGVNLQIFLDGRNDNAADTSDIGGVFEHERAYGNAWRTSVKYADAKKKEPGTWHWPEGSKKEESEA